MTESHTRLTGRQIYFLTLVSEGATIHQIARILGVGTRTIERELARLRTVIGAHSLAHAVKLGCRQGWLPAYPELATPGDRGYLRLLARSWHPDVLREAHRLYAAGVRTPPVAAGDMEYQWRKTARRRTAA